MARYKGLLALIGATLLAVLVNLGGAGLLPMLSKVGLTLDLWINRRFAWLVTILCFVFLIVAAGRRLTSRWDGIFIDERNRISLSRFQLVLWTALLVTALLTAGLWNIAKTETPLQIVVPPEVWALLGIGAFSFVAAPWVLDSKKNETPARSIGEINASLQRVDAETPPLADRRGSVTAKAAVADARWVDIVRGDASDSDTVDVSKVQQLAFTVLLIVVYASALFAKFGGDGLIEKFPPVDGGFVALLGLSHAAYLAYKKTAA